MILLQKETSRRKQPAYKWLASRLIIIITATTTTLYKQKQDSRSYGITF